ncbi:uncharacterized protein IL334_002609 [Kwoniella shivajii]|uniref:Rab proteins geranylgeranyltransferase n=1 Tax=Kwoniella shivajii TaxID=564305 RepID=A0ABZ1CV75_9TREE|nr:hypothetical protein IL334_002609 [Kwoniella shivajii]
MAELESDHYDVIVIGTGLAESIAAASLAKAGQSVLHLDPNVYYGGEQASLTLDELSSWSNTINQSSSSSASSSSSCHSSSIRYHSSSTTPLTPQLENDRRRYSLSLFPSILPSRGSLIDTLIASDVSKYVSFKLLDSTSIYAEEGVKKVPGSKEEIFKDKSIGLVDKRKLMKFLLFATGEFENDDLLKGKEDQPLSTFLQGTFSIPQQLTESISYAIAHCSSPNDQTLPALQRTRRYLKSIGRYGGSAFLVGQYGGAGEVAQGFCRACAVFGGTYVLGPTAAPTSIETTPDGVLIQIPCHPRPVTASHLVSAPIHLPPSLLTCSNTDTKETTSSNCIAITATLPEALRRRSLSVEEDDEEKPEPENDDTAVIVFPREENAVRAYINGEGTGSCPAGQYIIYLSTAASSPSTSPSAILRPYLQKITNEPTFEAYYVATRPSYDAIKPESTGNLVILEPYIGDYMLTEGLDWEAKQGEKAYYAIMGREGKGFFEKDPTDEEEMGFGEDDL